jgi:hypothetical protein
MRRYVKPLGGVVGFDTETLKTGYAFLLCDGGGNHAWVRCAEDLFPFVLSGNRYVCYNMDFDAQAMLKWFGEDFCRELIKTTKATYRDIRVWYIPEKFLHFARGNVWTTFWDVAQYFAIQGRYVRLADAAGYVRMKKSDFPVADMDETYYDNPQLLEYCLNDAKVTGKLGELVVRTYSDAGVVVRTLSSPASVVESYIVDQMGVDVPDLNKVPEGAKQYAEEAIQPPWREFFKRGYFPRMYDYDLNSAYPAVVRTLPSLVYGSWTYKRGEPPKNALLGYVFCKVVVPDDAYVSWVNLKTRFGNSTPTGTFYATLTLSGLRHCNATPMRGWYFVSRVSYPLFKYVVDKLYGVKLRSRGFKRHLVKVTLASIYGKFHQSIEGEPGRLYNPFYAAEIMTDTRLRVYELAKQDPAALIGIHTDCVYSAKRLNVPTSEDELGGWSLRGVSPMLVVGLNHFEKGEGFLGYQMKMRPDQAKYLERPERERPVSLLEALQDGNSFEDANVFMTHADEVDVTQQVHKRLWLGRPACGGDLLSNVYDSVPYPAHVVESMDEKCLWRLG